MHNWDGRRLRTGVVPAVTLEDYPARAAEALRKLRGNLPGTLAGNAPCPRPLAWALVHFLMSEHPRRFRRLARRLDRREEPWRAWQEVFGDLTPGLSADLAAHLAANVQPWKVVWIAWQQRGDAIEGRSDTNALAVLKRTPASLSAEIEATGGWMKAGLAFGYRSEEDFHLFQAVGGRWRVLRRKGTVWVHLRRGRLPAPPPGGRHVLTVAPSKGAAALRANGREVASVAVEAGGKVGLNVDGCTARFRVMASPAEPTPKHPPPPRSE
jgi:hypothetical protein